MPKFLPYVLKTLWRHRTRTLLTVTGAAVALLVFCFVGAVQSGLRQLTADQSANRTLIVFQENRFCPQSSRLPEDYARWIAKQPGVADVIPIKVFTNNCRASLDSIVFHGMPPEKLKACRSLRLPSGSWGAFESQDDAALAGRAVAQRRGLKTGDKFTIGDVSVVVAGIFESSTAAEESLVYTHLPFLQQARGRNELGTVTQLEVRLTSGADVDAMTAMIDERFRSGPVATSTRTKGMFQAETIADLAEMIEMIHWLGYGCVGLVLALVCSTTLMSVQDRIKEHAVLQTLGFRPSAVFRLVVTESALMSMLGGLLGIGGALVLLLLGRLSVSAEGVTIAFRPSWQLAMIGFGVSAMVGVLAGIAPAWQAARTQIITALRSS